jgi:hypothetical protein
LKQAVNKKLFELARNPKVAVESIAGTLEQISSDQWVTVLATADGDGDAPLHAAAVF